MDLSSYLNLGLAAVIAFGINRKIDAFIEETRKSNQGLLAVFTRIGRSVDNHGQRLDRIEEFLVSDDEPVAETQIAGFQATNSLAKT